MSAVNITAAGVIVEALKKAVEHIGPSVVEGFKTAQQDAIETSRLRHSMGALSTDFDLLQGLLRGAADAAGMLDSEAIKSAKSIASISGQSNALTLAKDVATSGQLAKAFGVDQSQTASFVGSMRLTGSDPERMGRVIGEAIGKSGAFAKTGEMMNAVASFATASHRASLTGQEGATAHFTGMLGQMTSSGRTNDVEGLAKVLSNADSAFRSSGGANARLSAYKRLYGKDITAADVQRINEQGLFGSAADVFKPGSMYYDAADEATKARYKKIYEGMQRNGSAGKTNADALIDQLEAKYGDSTQRQKELARQLFGGNESYAVAFEAAYKRHGSATGLGKKVENIVGGPVSMENALRASVFLGANDDSLLNAGAENLLKGHGFSNKLTKDEEDRLKSLKDGGEATKKEYRKELVRLSATREWDEDKGGLAARSLNAANNNLTRAMDEPVQTAAGLRDVLVGTGGKPAKDLKSISERVAHERSYKDLPDTSDFVNVFKFPGKINEEYTDAVFAPMDGAPVTSWYTDRTPSSQLSIPQQKNVTETIKVEGVFTLRDPSGRQVADPVNIHTTAQPNLANLSGA